MRVLHFLTFRTVRALAAAALLSAATSCVFVVHDDEGTRHTHSRARADEAAGPAAPDEARSVDELGYAMRSYWFGMIKRGPNYEQDMPDDQRAALQQAHLDRIGEIASEGKMILAGPFGPQPESDDPYIGLFLYTVPTRAEAEALAASDPAVQAGRLKVEIVEWYGVAGITYPGNPVPDAAAAPEPAGAEDAAADG